LEERDLVEMQYSLADARKQVYSVTAR